MNLLNLIASDSFITVNKALIKEYGLHEAILLGLLASKQEYWESHGGLDDEGFFYCTAEQIEEETTLSSHKQRKAIENLEASNVLRTKVVGIPPKKHFSISENQLLKNLTFKSEKIDDLNVEKFNTNNNRETIIKNNNKEYTECFERLWKLYPKKRGKGQVSEKKKKELYEIGESKIAEAIERYKVVLRREKTDDKYIQNGSTFFNSGYVDYLDGEGGVVESKHHSAYQGIVIV